MTNAFTCFKSDFDIKPLFLGIILCAAMHQLNTWCFVKAKMIRLKRYLLIINYTTHHSQQIHMLWLRQTYSHVQQSKYHNNVDTLTPHNHLIIIPILDSISSSAGPLLPFAPQQLRPHFRQPLVPPVVKNSGPSWFSSLP